MNLEFGREQVKDLIIDDKYSMTCGNDKKGMLTFLDSGAVGVIFKGEIVENKIPVCLKIVNTFLNIETIEIYIREQLFLNECERLERLVSVPNILRMLHYECYAEERVHLICKKGEKLYLHVVMEPKNEDAKRLVRIANGDLKAEKDETVLEFLNKFPGRPDYDDMAPGGLACAILRRNLQPTLDKSGYTGFKLLNGSVLLITDHYEQSLHDLMNAVRVSGKELPIEAKFKILECTASALMSLHTRDLAHLDLCPPNIMWNSFDKNLDPDKVPENSTSVWLEYHAYLIDIGFFERSTHSRDSSLKIPFFAPGERGRIEWQAPEMRNRTERADDLFRSVKIEVNPSGTVEGGDKLVLELQRPGESDEYDTKSLSKILIDKTPAAESRDETETRPFRDLQPKDSVIVGNHMFRLKSRVKDNQKRFFVDKVYRGDPHSGYFSEFKVEDVLGKEGASDEKIFSGTPLIHRFCGPAADLYSFGILMYYLLLDLNHPQLKDLSTNVHGQGSDGFLRLLSDYKRDFDERGLSDFQEIANKCLFRGKRGYCDGHRDEQYRILTLIRDLDDAQNRFMAAGLIYEKGGIEQLRRGNESLEKENEVLSNMMESWGSKSLEAKNLVDSLAGRLDEIKRTARRLESIKVPKFFSKYRIGPFDNLANQLVESVIIAEAKQKEASAVLDELSKIILVCRS